MSFETALQQAIYSQLSSALAIPVFDDVPQGELFDYVEIGEADQDEFDTDTTLGAETVIIIHAWSRYRGRKQVKEIQNDVYQSLQRAQLNVIGYHLVTCDFLSSETFVESDGKTRQGAKTFNVIIDEV